MEKENGLHSDRVKIKEEQLDGLDNKPITVKPVIYPQTIDANIPRNYFLSLFVGARGSGKTYLFCKLLKLLEQKKIYLDGKVVPQRVILVCCTAQSDSNLIFKNLKHIDWENDVIEDYTDQKLLNKMDEIKEDLQHSKDYKLYKVAWKKFKKCKEIDELSDDELKLLYKYDFIKFSEFPKPRYPDSFIVTIVIDDMVGTNIFKNGRSVLTNLCIRNRHIHKCNIIISCQHLMMIPKTIRLNANLIALFKFANKQAVLEDVYPTVSAYVTEKQFEELYNYATSEPHSALIVDATKSKIEFKKNLDKLLSF